jgi:hypothetical protein
VVVQLCTFCIWEQTAEHDASEADPVFLIRQFDVPIFGYVRTDLCFKIVHAPASRPALIWKNCKQSLGGSVTSQFSTEQAEWADP